MTPSKAMEAPQRGAGARLGCNNCHWPDRKIQVSLRGAPDALRPPKRMTPPALGSSYRAARERGDGELESRSWDHPSPLAQVQVLPRAVRLYPPKRSIFPISESQAMAAPVRPGRAPFTVTFCQLDSGLSVKYQVSLQGFPQLPFPSARRAKYGLPVELATAAPARLLGPYITELSQYGAWELLREERGIPASRTPETDGRGPGEDALPRRRGPTRLRQRRSTRSHGNARLPTNVRVPRKCDSSMRRAS